MRSGRAVGVLVCALAHHPALALAQTTVDGSAEWTVAKNASSSDAQSSSNGSLLQNYALGFSSSLWDPRLVRYNAVGIFRTSSLTAAATTQADQEGHQGDLGYKLGASILPSSALPFFVQASRTTSASSGDLGPSNPIRSGMIAPSGAPPVDFESFNKTLNLGWQLNLGSLPRVEVGYRRGSSIVTGGGYRSEQNDDDLSAAAFKDTAKTRQSFRYQHTAFENLLEQTFAQRLDNLDYDLGATLSPHTRLTAHAGRRSSFARSEFAATIVDSGAGAYTPPPSLGAAGADYVLGGFDYEPSGRFSIRLNGTLDRQIGELATTSAKLATLSSHFEVLRGLTLTAAGTSGTRGQLLDNLPIDVSTRNVVGGVTYQGSARWLTGTVGATRGLGTNASPEGLQGTTQAWSREASLSTTFGWLGLGAGYERVRNRDGVLDYGNYDSERLRTSVQADRRLMSLSLTADQVRVERGVGETFARNVQRTGSLAASLRLWHEARATVIGGGFVNDYTNAIGTGRDRTLFWSVGGQTVFRSTLRFSAWIRSEAAMASKTGFDQQVLSSFGRVEYRLRTLNLTMEYRQNHSLLQSLLTPEPSDFRGRQLRFSVIRQFGFRLA